MKKILKAGTIIVAAILMVSVGVYAALLNNSVNFNIGSNVTFTTGVGVRMDITGVLAGGFVEDDEALEPEDVRNYTGATYAADSEISIDADQWTIGDIEFVVVSGKAAITYTFTFTNAGTADTIVSIGVPSSLGSRLALTGGLSDGEVEPTYSNTGTAGTTVATKTLTFVYTLTLSDFSQNLGSTSINFTVEMALASDNP